MSGITIEDLDLQAFFGCAPICPDAGIPWPNNDFSYEYRSDNKSVLFTIMPASKDVRIMLKVGKQVVYELNAIDIGDVVCIKHSGRETLVLDLNERERLVLQLKPLPSISHQVNERT